MGELLNSEDKYLLQRFEFLIEDPYMGVIYIDTDCRILFLNQTLADILGVDKYDTIGNHINTVMPRSRLPQTIKTGESNLCEICSIKGRKMVVMRVPIYDEGKIIGAMSKSLFLEMSAAKNMANYLSSNGMSETDNKETIYQSKYSLDNIIGKSDLITHPKAISRQVASNISNVLIIGESGTGKELFAQAIHAAGSRCNSPFIRINCACIPENLLESELFGYDEGAFTGARKGGKKGKFELADRGTVFLDEVSEMPLSMQAKLLSFLQEREFERVGGSQPISTDVRIIAATNVNLEDAVLQGKFRDDLYYRLNVVTLMLPPLRDRVEDIPLLVDHFLDKLSNKLNCTRLTIDCQALLLLKIYYWPGNIRELENLLERAINLANLDNQTVIKEKHFPTLINQVDKNNGAENELLDISLGKAIENLEYQLISKTLKDSNYNKNLAAKTLDIHPSVLYRKLKKYNLS